MYRYQSSKPSLRPVEDADISEIARRHSEDPRSLSELMDNKPAWSPLTVAQIKEKIAEEQKKPHTSLFAIYSGETFIGMGYWSANWDTWSPWSWFIIWPEHRRKGHGTAVAELLLDKTFMENPGHAICAAVPGSDMAAQAFLRKQGFKSAGRMRRTHLVEGAFQDTEFFDILKPEYLKRRKGAEH